MKIPKQIYIAGRKYGVELHDDLAILDSLAGCASNNTGVIKLQNKSYHPEFIEQTFIHEVLHLIDINYLNGKLTEDQVDAMATGMYAFLKDNKLIK